MMNVVRSADPKLYKTLQSSAGMRRRDAVIKVLTEEKGPETQTLIDYLYGRVPFSALYPYEEQMAKNSHFYRGYRLRNLLDGFPAKDEDREFLTAARPVPFFGRRGTLCPREKIRSTSRRKKPLQDFLKTWKKREWMRRIC